MEVREGPEAVADRIVIIGSLGNTKAKRRIDVAGLTVAPGFIDMLGWSEIRILADGRAASKITQGITTEITGEGTSVAPQTSATIAQDAEYYGVKDGDRMMLRVNSGVPATFENIVARIDPSFKLEVHIDTDEGNACDLTNAKSVELVKA